MLTGALTGMLSGTACSPSSLVDVQSPSNVVDPSQIQNATAATQLRTGAIVRMMGAFGSAPYASVIGMSGYLTDELADNPYWNGGTGNDRNTLNTSLGKNTGGYGYDQIQLARVKAQQARQALQLYASNTPSIPRAWQGEMYALEGYTIVWLGELFCSGMPLTAAPLVGPQVPTRGFTTEELFTHAIALFDSAIVAGGDSARFVELARVGKARALLASGAFAAADSVVQSVATDFVYVIPSAVSTDDGSATNNFPGWAAYARQIVQDREGGNGLVWSTDPRTGVMTVPDRSGSMLWASKYNVNANGVLEPTAYPFDIPLRLADGLEARLIQAEAALHAGDPSWLTILNTLRATCVGTTPCAPVPGLTATSLPPLADPGTADARLDLLMQERAMWLYLTGHREGDLRRLAHVYSRNVETLWPTGTMSVPAYPPQYGTPGDENGLPYGHNVVYGPDINEHIRNPLYGGCYDSNP